MKKLLCLFIIIGSCIVLPIKSFAWDDGKTHPDLSGFAAEDSVLSNGHGDCLRNIGFNSGLTQSFSWNGLTKTVEEWIQYGATFEDRPLSRSFNHFHNPLKSWDQAGLNDTVLLVPVTGESSLLWAQDGAYQQSSAGEDWSWQKTREYSYIALTGKDFTGADIATTKAARAEYFARTFKGLGHQMHLIQDAGQPDHVRNDAHPTDSLGFRLYGSRRFEKWAKDNYAFVNSIAENPIFPAVSFNVSNNGLAPVTQLIDTMQYKNSGTPSTSQAQGIAEYTSANFASEHTIFTEDRSPNDPHHFPYPRAASTDLQDYVDQNKLSETVIGEDGISDTGFWIKKDEDGEIINHFVRPSYFSRETFNIVGGGPLFERTFYRDEKCHEDYAAKLIPRAVGYSTGLLNYFFRGQIMAVNRTVTKKTKWQYLRHEFKGQK